MVLGRTVASAAGAYGIIPTDDLGGPIWAAAGIILLGGIAISQGWTGRTTQQNLVILISAAAVVLVPFALHPLAAGRLPIRTLVGVPFAVWLFAYTALKSRQPTTSTIAMAAVLVAIFQSAVLGNSYQASNYFVSRHDLLLANSIFDKISNLPEYDPRKTYRLALYGGMPFRSVYPQPPSSVVGRSFFEWDGGNPHRIAAYLRQIGYSSLKVATPADQDEVIATLQRMPIFPSPGSVAIRGDIILLRLGDQPNRASRSALERTQARSP